MNTRSLTRMLSFIGIFLFSLTFTNAQDCPTCLVGPPSCTARIAFVGARYGNLAWDDALTHGDIAGSIGFLDSTTFNSMSPSQLRDDYDVLVFGWNSPTSVNAPFLTKIGPYMDLGGSILWEDEKNVADMNDLPGFDGQELNGGGPYIVYTIPGNEIVSAGITNVFVNHHIRINTHPPWLNVWIRHGTTNDVLAVLGEYGTGKIMVSGPDHDFHAVDSVGHINFNQYRVIVNQFEWLCRGSGVSLCPDVDTVNPVLGCPDPETILVDDTCTVPLSDIGAATTVDDCDENVTLDVSPAVGTPLSPGVHVVGVTGTDTSGNQGVCSISVTVVDNIPPVLTCTPQTVSVESVCNEPLPVMALGTDNCSIGPLASSPTVGTVLGLGSHTISVSVIDSSGNPASCSTVFTVVDTTPPVLTCPVDQKIEVNEKCEALVPDADTDATDVCPPVSLSVSPLVGSTLGLGTNTIVVTGTDGSGNSASCSTVVTVVDTTPPDMSGLTVTPNILWPPNHKFHEVTISGVDDDCDMTCEVTGVAVSDSDTGETDHVDDWDLDTGNPNSVNLRAERDPNDEFDRDHRDNDDDNDSVPTRGNGRGRGPHVDGDGDRTYTLTVLCTDSSGNVNTSTVDVVVPLKAP